MARRARRGLGLVTTLAAAAAVMTAGGAGAGAATSDGPDLSSRAAIETYLQSIGVDPASVTWQTGARNYAGPNCPGVDWNCTTATQVVQVTPQQAGGENVVVCEPGGVGDDEDPTTETCLIVQAPADRNRAECRIRTTTDAPVFHQDCTVTQGGDRNYAVVEMFLSQTTPELDDDEAPTSDQEGTQSARVTQTATGTEPEQQAPAKNELHLYQTIEQFTDAGTVQEQDAHHRADVIQSATGTVGNFSHTHQGQDQEMVGDETTTHQRQNTEYDDRFDCDQSEDPDAPNICAFVDQDTDNGVDDAQIHQALHQRMTTDVVPTLQQQGFDPSGTTGGLEGEKSQTVAGSDGTNQAAAHQVKRLQAFAPKGTPPENTQQYDEARCCGATSSNGGKHNTLHVTQHAALTAPDGAGQVIDLLAQTRGTAAADDDNGGDGGLTSLQVDGGKSTCHVNQTGRVNDDASSGSTTDSGDFECRAVQQTSCVSGDVRDPDGGIEILQENGEEPPPPCETAEVPPPICVECVVDGSLFTSLAASPTFGLPLDEDIFGEPSDYTGPALP